MRSPTVSLLIALLLTACSSEFGESSIDGTVPAGSSVGPAIDVGALSPSPDDLGPFGACVTGTVVAERVPAVLQMVVDTSGSMEWPPGWSPTSNTNMPLDAATKWDITKRALRNAVTELPPETALGVSFYPNISHSGSTCIKNQIALPIGALGDARSGQRDHFREALDDVEPRGGTPTHGAYRFGTQALLADRRGGHRFVLLITDGSPTYTVSCAGDGRTAVDSGPLIAEAAALLEHEGVRTFVIGSPGSEDARSALSRVARAGGTAAAGCSSEGPAYCHFDMTNEHDLGAALERVLSTISTRIASCDYPIPPPPAGQSLDKGRVNVVFTPEPGTTEVIARDADGSCEDGWQYSSDGKRVMLCGKSCERVKSQPGGEVELFFGCATTVSAPR